MTIGSAQRVRTLFAAVVCVHALAAYVTGSEEPADYVPQTGKFPPPNCGHYFAGELVSVDHVNRRGALRLIGDGDDARYHSAPSHRFAMLPYGTLRYHGAPAELRDIPIGTVLHGYFVLPPEGDTTILLPEKNPSKYLLKYTHALSLEDDFSFYQRRGQSWKIVSVDSAKGKIKVSLIGQAAQAANDGLKGEQTFDFDASTRIWKGRQIGELKDLTAEQDVQVNLTWTPDWQNTKFQINDVWIDKESRDVAAEVQRQIHIRFMHHRWLPGWVDNVEYQGGSKGIVTVTLFGGMDPSLYDQARAQKPPHGGASIACAEKTLRTWWQNHDSKGGSVLDFKDIPNPLPNSSGLQMRVQINELLEGYRPGRIIRFFPNSFIKVKLPPEECIQSMDDR